MGAGDDIFAGIPSHMGWPGVVCKIATADDEAGTTEAERFWDRIIGDDDQARLWGADPADTNPSDFLIGFTEGVAQVWSEVEADVMQK